MEAPCAQSTRGGELGGFCGAWLAPLVPQSWRPEKLCALQELGMGVAACAAGVEGWASPRGCRRGCYGIAHFSKNTWKAVYIQMSLW